MYYRSVVGLSGLVADEAAPLEFGQPVDRVAGDRRAPGAARVGKRFWTATEDGGDSAGQDFRANNLDNQQVTIRALDDGSPIARLYGVCQASVALEAAIILVRRAVLC